MSKTTAAVLDESLETEEAELTDKQVINEAIGRVVESLGIDVQKNRYKAMRAIAFQAFTNAIADGTFDELVDEAIANVDNLPSGWEIERTAKEEAEKPAPKAKTAPKAAAAKAPAKKAPAKAAAAKPATARKRPTR